MDSEKLPAAQSDLNIGHIQGTKGRKGRTLNEDKILDLKFVQWEVSSQKQVPNDKEGPQGLALELSGLSDWSTRLRHNA